MCELKHLANRFIDLQRLFPWRRFLDEITDATGDVARTIAVLDDATERLPYLLQIGRRAIQPTQRRLGVADGPGDGLVHFMDDRCRQLPQSGKAARMLQLHLHLAASPLALARFFFCPLALGDVSYQGKA